MHKSRRTTIAVLALLAGMATLTACGTSGAESSSNHKEEVFKLSDGREVLCISTTLVGSFSCDWGNAK